MTEHKPVADAISALREGTHTLGVWGCGHIGASAMYHFTRKGIRCIGYDIAEERVREILQGRFLSTDVVPSGRIEAEDANVEATTDWQDLKSRNVAVHIISIPTERGAEPSSAPLEDVMPHVCEVIRESKLEGVT